MGIAERKEREKQQRREEIITAAEKVFFTRGFEDSTMDDIAGKAELSKGTLYLYFKSKEDLHMAVAHKAVSMLKSTMAGIEKKPVNAMEKLASMGRSAVEFSRQFPDHMKSIMVLEGSEFQNISISITQVREAIYNDSPVGMLIRIVEQGVKEKLIREDIPPPIIAHTLWMQTLSVIRFVTMKSALIEVFDLTPANIYESHFELVLNGIRL